MKITNFDILNKVCYFYEFYQNNSGGSFDINWNRGITIKVYIEASNYEEANYLAENIGIYFNGVDDDIDCSCCGDRWYHLHNDCNRINDIQHLLNDDYILLNDLNFFDERLHDNFIVAIHYLDGVIERYGNKYNNLKDI